MNNELLASKLSNEAQLWLTAPDHEYLSNLWKARLNPQELGLTEQQTKAVLIAQTAVFALSTQAVALRAMEGMVGLLKTYALLKR